MPSIYKVIGTKIVPSNRFNLEPAKPSIIFESSKSTPKKQRAFVIKRHNFLTSIQQVKDLIIKEYQPLVVNQTNITQDTIFQDRLHKGVSLCFPKVEIVSSNEKVFYYEEMLDNKGEIDGYIGKVVLKYQTILKPETDTLKNIILTFSQAVLNLQATNEIIKIIGTVDELKNEITFNIKDEAVKIAFFNLSSTVLNANLDLFFKFNAYFKQKEKLLVARKINNFSKSRIDKPNIFSTSVANTFFNPLILKVPPNRVSATHQSMQNSRDVKTIQKDELTKGIYFLKINHILKYPFPSLAFQTGDGGFNNNPFNLNQDYSSYEQIFVPGYDFNKVSIYKSKLTANEFLLIPKKYHITRTNDLRLPCIQTIFFAGLEGSSLSEEISQINFQMAIGPDFSEFELARLKIELFNHKFLDGESSEFIDQISFVYPSEIGAHFEITGNHFLQQAEVSIDGKHLLLSITTENLNDASILISAINNSLSQYANLNFKYKEIKDSSIIEINIQKTTGELLDIVIDNAAKTVKMDNMSLAACKVLSTLTFDHLNRSFYNSSFFESILMVESNQGVEVVQMDLDPNLADQPLKRLYANYDCIEDISKDFSQIVDSTNAYYRYIQVNIKDHPINVNKIQIEFIVESTDCKYLFEKLRPDFNQPILLNFITPNVTNVSTIILYNVKTYDQDNNQLSSKSASFDYSISSLLYIN